MSSPTEEDNAMDNPATEVSIDIGEGEENSGTKGSRNRTPPISVTPTTLSMDDAAAAASALDPSLTSGEPGPASSEGINNRKKSILKQQHIMARSLDAGLDPSYGTSSATQMSGANPSYQNNAASGRRTPVVRNKFVFCIHGNKFGYARCCDDFDVSSSRSVPVRGSLDGDDDGERRPLLPSGGGGGGGSACGPSRASSTWRRESHGRVVPNDGGDAGSHCHTGAEPHQMDKSARRALSIASVLCLIFMGIETAGGVMANSLAIATDAAHLLSDFASFMISLFALYLGSRPPTQRMSFGWHRAEIIGATTSVLLIWVVTGILVYMAIQRLIQKEFEIDATVMLITSGIGLVFNIIMGVALHPPHTGPGGGGHSHSNINVRAAFIHVIGDFIQSLGVFITALIIYFYPNLVILDPILTFVFSVLVLFTTLKLLKETVNVLMEGTPTGYSYEVVKSTFMAVDGMLSVHDIRMWSLSTGKNALSAHLAINSSANPHAVLKEAATRIREKYNFFEITLQVEEFNEDMQDCNQCQTPES